MAIADDGWIVFIKATYVACSMMTRMDRAVRDNTKSCAFQPVQDIL